MNINLNFKDTKKLLNFIFFKDVFIILSCNSANLQEKKCIQILFIIKIYNLIVNLIHKSCFYNKYNSENKHF